ncbi:hypothetical protein I6A60_27860 [Frankia sp. AgB1.9]|uniref:hypothetical protein n=1 Tax=unclassified Frankia TaxID=2632575 RepID=UPI001931C55D|nr:MULTISPECIES: hypothetical protein [unclassified Frankia]MBL7494561.1 hypothetical protein [Frankia sp. AgW1.1]MBL7551647.1 hypothetical protein [Frankia sp. AgB1.9]MBL7624186.1 hypothetical protein [Frankia sp. AgB1.8]
MTESVNPGRPNGPKALEQSFHRAMVGVYERAKREASYNASYFLRMISNDGGLATARSLLQASKTSDGFAALSQIAPGRMTPGTPTRNRPA